MNATRDNNEVCQFRAAVAARFYRSCNSVAVVNVKSALVVTVAQHTVDLNKCLNTSVRRSKGQLSFETRFVTCFKYDKSV